MTKLINTWAASTEVQSDFDLGPKSSSDEQWAPQGSTPTAATGTPSWSSPHRHLDGL